MAGILHDIARIIMDLKTRGKADLVAFGWRHVFWDAVTDAALTEETSQSMLRDDLEAGHFNDVDGHIFVRSTSPTVRSGIRFCGMAWPRASNARNARSRDGCSSTHVVGRVAVHGCRRELVEQALHPYSAHQGTGARLADSAPKVVSVHASGPPHSGGVGFGQMVVVES
jgi:hypothetical protein